MGKLQDFLIMVCKIGFYGFSFYAFRFIFGPELKLWWLIIYCWFIACGDWGIGLARKGDGFKKGGRGE